VLPVFRNLGPALIEVEGRGVYIGKAGDGVWIEKGEGRR